MGFNWLNYLTFGCVLVILAFLSLPANREYGILLSHSYKPEEATPYLHEAIAKNPDDRRVTLELAETYRQRQRPVEGARKLQDFLTRHPDDHQIRKKAIALYQEDNSLDQAIRLYETMPGPEGKDLAHLSDLYEQTGRLAEAVELTRSQMDNTPADAERWKQILRLAQWQGDPALVSEALRGLYGADRKVGTLHQLMQYEAWRGDLQGALRVAEALNQKDLTAEQLRSILSLQIRVRNLPASLAAARRLVTLPAATAVDWIDLCQLTLWSGENSKALDIAMEGLGKHPENTDLLTTAASLALTLNRPEALSLNIRLARVEKGLAEWQTVLELARSSIAEGPPGETSRQLLAGQLAHLPAAPRPEAQILQIRIAELSGNPSRAEAWYKELKAQPVPANPVPLIALAFERKDPEWATKLLQPIEKDLTAPQAIELAQAYQTALLPDRAYQLLAQYDNRPDMPARYNTLLTEVALDYRQMDGDKPADLDSRLLTLLEDNLRQVGPTGMRPYWRQELVRLYLQTNRLAAARNLLASGPAVGNDLYLAAAETAIEMGQNKAAAAFLKNVRPSPEMPAAALSYLAYLHLELKETESAIRYYEMAYAKTGGKDREILLGLARAYGLHGNRQKEYALMDEAAHDEKTWLAAIDRRRWNRDTRGEAEAVEKALSRFPASPTLLARGIDVYGQLKDREQIQALYKRLVAVDGKSALSHLAMCRVFLAMEQPVEAQDQFALALTKTKNPGASADTELAEVAAAVGRRALAIAIYENAVNKKTVEPLARYRLAEIKEEAGLDPRPDLRLFLAAGKIPPGAWREKALALWKVGPREEAWQVMLKALPAPPEDYLDLIDRMFEARWHRQLDLLLSALEKTSPENRELLRRRARLHREGNRLDPAREILTALKSRYPRDSDILGDFGVLEEQAGHFHRAHRYFREAIALRRRARP